MSRRGRCLDTRKEIEPETSGRMQLLTGSGSFGAVMIGQADDVEIGLVLRVVEDLHDGVISVAPTVVACVHMQIGFADSGCRQRATLRGRRRSWLAPQATVGDDGRNGGKHVRALTPFSVSLPSLLRPDVLVRFSLQYAC